MKLEGKRVQSDQIDLYLTIDFNEQCELLPSGSVSFGLKGGQLKLTLENGKIPYEFRDLTGSFELSHPKERQESQARKALSNVEFLGAETHAKPKASNGTEESESTTAQFQVTTCQIATKGSQTNPGWVFEVETGEPILKGSLKNVKLATLKAIAFPCRVEATFEVSLQDIYLTKTEGLWSQNINRNQQIVLERGIAQLLLKRKLKPYLNRVELRYD
jgi:hypothetical protein